MGGMVYYFVFVNIIMAVMDFYGNLQWNLLLKFSYRNYIQKNEYQNVLGNLDEAIIWQKEGCIQYYNINGLNILKDHLMHEVGGIQLITKLKAFYTQLHHNVTGLVLPEELEALGESIFNSELFSLYRPLNSGPEQ